MVHSQKAGASKRWHCTRYWCSGTGQQHAWLERQAGLLDRTGQPQHGQQRVQPGARQAGGTHSSKGTGCFELDVHWARRVMCRTCMMILRSGVALRRSKSATLRSLPVVANKSASACACHSMVGRAAALIPQRQSMQAHAAWAWIAEWRHKTTHHQAGDQTSFLLRKSSAHTSPRTEQGTSFCFSWKSMKQVRMHSQAGDHATTLDTARCCCLGKPCLRSDRETGRDSLLEGMRLQERGMPAHHVVP